MNNKRLSVREILAQNLKDLMGKHHFKQKDVERKSGHPEPGSISQKTISNILSQEHSANIDQLDILSRVFGVDPAELISKGMEFVKFDPSVQSILETVKKIPRSNLEQANMVLEAFIPKAPDSTAEIKPFQKKP